MTAEWRTPRRAEANVEEDYIKREERGEMREFYVKLFPPSRS